MATQPNLQAALRGEDLTSRIISTTNNHLFPVTSKLTQVYACDKDGTEQVCVKVPLTDLVQAFRDDVQLTMLTTVPHGVTHPNIVPYLGFCTRDNLYGVVSPLYSNGTITRFARDIENDGRVALLREVGIGLAHLYRLEIVHGALHPGNVLIDDDRHARLTDFQRNNVLIGNGARMTDLMGPLRYLPPEHISEQGINPNILPSRTGDIYCFAILIFEVLAGSEWVDNSEPCTLERIANGNRPERDGDQQGRISDPLWDALVSCWSATPTERPTLSQLMSIL